MHEFGKEVGELKGKLTTNQEEAAAVQAALPAREDKLRLSGQDRTELTGEVATLKVCSVVETCCIF